jgi:TRAP-type C4-dicarboxylate transport system substrate-binding protein
MERLIEAVEILEATMENASATPAVSASAEEIAEKIVATVETQREAELERKLAQAEAKIAQLEASAVSEKSTGRKTLPNAMSSLLAKQGVAVDGLEAGALDAALTSLSIEQRIAVKAELLRTGMLG